jgi:hypothetical protein
MPLSLNELLQTLLELRKKIALVDVLAMLADPVHFDQIRMRIRLMKKN